MWYLDLSAKALALIASVWLSVALSHLGSLIHSQEPEVTGVDVHDRPQVTNINLWFQTLLITLLRRHRCCYRYDRVEDEGGNLKVEDTTMMSSVTHAASFCGSINERTLTMISSTVTEPLRGLLGCIVLSNATEHGLSTCGTNR